MASDIDLAIGEVLDEFRDVYGMTLSAAVVEAFREVLSGCTAKEITRAAVEHMKTSKFAPRPAELLAIIKARRDQETISRKQSQFWKDTEEARKNRCTTGYRKPEGVSVLEHYQNLLAAGMTKEQALKEMCE